MTYDQQKLIADIKIRINQASNDIFLLNEIAKELAQIPGKDAQELKIRIVGLKRIAAGAQVPIISIKSVISRFGLPKPDGRPLYRYQLNDADFKNLTSLLRKAGAPGFAHAGSEIASLFVLWGAQWFQRAYRGGMRRWDHLFAALNLRPDGNEARRMVRGGLLKWARPAVQGDQQHLWLRTLAVEGGFPSGILEEADGWLSRYLSRVVSALLTVEFLDIDIAFVAAANLADLAPQAYRQEIFYALAADLAMAVAHFRQQADEEERPRGVSISEWLDLKHAGWREELPISTSHAAAAKLVDGLVESEKIVSLHGENVVGCQRFFQKHDGMWRPALRLGLDGAIASGLIPQAYQSHRLRAFPASAFARYTKGEIAVLEPPVQSEDGWRVRPSRADVVVQSVPFNLPVTVELRADGKSIVQTKWPKGEVVRGEFCILAGDILDGTGSNELTLIGTGSGEFKPKIVFVAAPKDWRIVGDADGPEAEELDDIIEDGRKLWRLPGPALIKTSGGDAFRVIPDRATSRQDELVVEGPMPSGFDSEDPEIELFAGIPRIRVREGARIREPLAGEIVWRTDGDRDWRSSVPTVRGRLDIAWKEKAGFIRDRRKVAVFKAGAGLGCRRQGDGMIYDPQGFSASAIVSRDENLILEDFGPSVFARFPRHPSRRAKLRLQLDSSKPIDIVAPFKLGAGIATWSGVRISGGSAPVGAARLSLAELAECVAFADGHDEVRARLRDRSGQPLSELLIWPFIDELPLRSVASELSSMVASFGIDVSVEITLRDQNAFWQAHQFEMSVLESYGRLRTVAGFSRNDTVELYGRRVDQPWDEQRLAEWTFEERLRLQLPALPTDLRGTWIVYGRRDETVISRPIVKGFPLLETEPEGLGMAATLSDWRERDGAIRHCFQDVENGADAADADVEWLLKLCGSLHGLPPASFDALQHLPEFPAAAARIALRATKEQLRAVLDVAEGLPFNWFAIPVADWTRAADNERKAQFRLLAAAVPEQLAQEIAERSIVETIKAIVLEMPILEWPLWAATGVSITGRTPPMISIVGSAQGFIQRCGDEFDEKGRRDSVYREKFPGQLPTAFDRFDAVFLEALDAPCAAALIAAKGNKIDQEIARRFKLAYRDDPLYFVEAFTSRFLTLAAGGR